MSSATLTTDLPTPPRRRRERANTGWPSLGGLVALLWIMLSGNVGLLCTPIETTSDGSATGACHAPPHAVDMIGRLSVPGFLSASFGALIGQAMRIPELGAPLPAWRGVPPSNRAMRTLGPDVPWVLGGLPVPESMDICASSALGADGAAARFGALGLRAGYTLHPPTDPHGVYTAVQTGADASAQRVVHLDQYSGRVLVDVAYRDYGRFAQAVERMHAAVSEAASGPYGRLLAAAAWSVLATFFFVGLRRRATRAVVVTAFVAAVALPAFGVLAAAASAADPASNTVEAAGGVPGAARDVSRTVEITLSDAMRFAPEALAVRRGQTVRFVLRNEGQVDHEFVLGDEHELEAHANEMAHAGAMIHPLNAVALKPGAAAELVWTFRRSGVFAFGCLVPGHYQAGMRGVLRVEEDVTS